MHSNLPGAVGAHVAVAARQRRTWRQARPWHAICGVGRPAPCWQRRHRCGATAAEARARHGSGRTVGHVALVVRVVRRARDALQSLCVVPRGG
eukprot:356753-Chlamydomonas_euryale.AAC.6